VTPVPNDHELESVGRDMRRMMPFLDAKEVLPGLRGVQPSGTASASASKKAEKEVPVAGAAR
jgi:hypothetical protein